MPPHVVSAIRHKTTFAEVGTRAADGVGRPRLDYVSHRDTFRGVRHHRQERWLHTRITEHLEGALKREARRKRQPVSLLVRNVLEGALDLVEEIVEDGLAVAQRSHRLASNLGRSAHSPNADAK